MTTESIDDGRIQVIGFDPSTLSPGDVTVTTESGPVRLYSRAQVRTAVADGLKLAADEAHVSSYADRFAWESAVMTLLDQPSALWAEVKSRHHSATDDIEAADDEAPQYTREQISQAVNNGVDLPAAQERRTVADDLDNLIVNAALTLLDDPDADFYKVVTKNYGESPRVVRSWL
ncbi:hypothetical protein [Streptomyces cavernicola]|uniref:Uncharacterized protein n=1 Tax=Streptomyces cavernicola TaxID=3043613 RepID=A0ABT6SPC7_9ACTN|nr:hypothetical protein [Streptomyces sp. B-S-A6]MDI3409283.1 hypothetical protein [Streptomyces sp. B-S-A6]